MSRVKPQREMSRDSEILPLFNHANTFEKVFGSGGRSKAKESKTGFDPFRPVPDDMKILDAGDHFWMYGLRRYDDTRKPNTFWQWQFFSLLVHSVFLSRSLFILATMTNDRELIVKGGDFYTLMDPGAGRVYLHLCIVVIQIFLLYSGVKYLFVEPCNWFGLFEVLKGLKAPVHIGIYEHAIYCRLLQRVKKLISIGVWFCKIGKFLMFFMYGGILTWAHEETLELYWLAPHMIWLFYWKDLMCAWIAWQLVYFSIGCCYLKERLLQVAYWISALDQILGKRRQNHMIVKLRMKRIFIAMNRIQNQVYIINKDLGFFVPSLIGTMMFSAVATEYYAFFTHNPNWFLQALFGYWGCFFYLQLSFLFLAAHMVSKASRKPYKMLVRIAATRTGLPLTAQTQIWRTIESYSGDKRQSRKFGFHCYTWFLLSLNRYVVITFTTGALMMSLITLSSKYEKENAMLV